MRFELGFAHRFADRAMRMDLSGGQGVTALFGPSGAGKTTAIKVMAGLLTPETGWVTLGDRVLFDSNAGTNVPPHKRRMGYVFQDGRLFPHLNVLQNLRFGASFSDRKPPLSETLLVDLLGLPDLLTRRPATLSGGETQRVALARALLSAPDMLLMDEPLAALDGPRKDDILPYIDRLKSETRIPILYVTHSVEEMARLADRIVLLRDGEVLQQGRVFDVLSDPEAMPMIGVREAGAILQAKVASHAADGLATLQLEGGSLELPGVEAAVGDIIRLRILARDVILATERPTGLSARNILPVEIIALHTGRGPGTAVVLQIGEQRLLARVTDRSVQEMALRPGKQVFAVLKSTSVARGAISR